MFRFDRCIRPSMTVRDVKREYPLTQAVFERFGFRDTCDDCSIEIVARRQDLSVLDVIDALNSAILRPSEKPQ